MGKKIDFIFTNVPSIHNVATEGSNVLKGKGEARSVYVVLYDVAFHFIPLYKLQFHHCSAYGGSVLVVDTDYILSVVGSEPRCGSGDARNLYPPSYKFFHFPFILFTEWYVTRDNRLTTNIRVDL